jgi:hypothetical protein
MSRPVPGGLSCDAARPTPLNSRSTLGFFVAFGSELFAGAASAIAGTSSDRGGALGIALLGTIGTAVYRVTDAVPAGVPHEAADAARDTLGGAVAAGGGLPGEIGGAVVHAAREASRRDSR